MIRTWKNAELQQLFETGSSRRIDTKLQKRCIGRLDALNRTNNLRKLFLPGYELHKYPNFRSRYSISVTGHWRILFDWHNGDAYNVDLVQPHG